MKKLTGRQMVEIVKEAHKNYDGVSMHYENPYTVGSKRWWIFDTAFRRCFRRDSRKKSLMQIMLDAGKTKAARENKRVLCFVGKIGRVAA